MIDLGNTEFKVPAHKEVYPEKIRKLSKRRRKPCNKNRGVLEYGNSAIVVKFGYTVELFNKLTLWWEKEYEEQGEQWNTELFTCPQGGYIEVVIFETTAFYRADDFHLKSVQDEPEVYFSKGINLVPEEYHHLIKSVQLEDYDYSTNEDRVI